MDEVTHDGYRIVPYSPPAPMTGPKVVGTQCGRCGMRIKNHQATSYSCPNAPCPMGLGSSVSMLGGPL